MRENHYCKLKRLSMIAGSILLATMQYSDAADKADKADKVAQVDRRIPITLTTVEHAYILGNMRLHLADIQTIVSALSAGDAARASEAANNLGTKPFKTNSSRPPELLKKLPAGFMQMTEAYHRDFDSLTDGIKSGEPSSRSLQRLATAIRGCVACHAAYRITASIPDSQEAR